jgi:hypothetical protein
MGNYSKTGMATRIVVDTDEDGKDEIAVLDNASYTRDKKGVIHIIGLK